MKHTFLKLALGTALVAGIAAGAVGSQFAAFAQEVEPQVFTVMAGANGPGNVEALTFGPQALQVHRGDTVTWVVNGFHDIRFDSQPLPLVVAPEVNGDPLPQINPAIAFRSIESGSAYTGGAVGSGLPTDGAPYSLTIDMEPGTYSYLCDVHPGMVGTITVVADDVAIPNPVEASLQGANELGSAIGASLGALVDLEAQSLPAMETNQITMGSANTGRVTVNQFFPFTTVITAGESVVWTNPEGSIEPHIVGWPPLRNQDVAPIPVEGQPPILAVGPSLTPMTPSESTITPGQEFSSGLIFPGQSYTLTFSEPGVYSYTCHIHPGMTGTIVVQPAA